MKATKLLKTTNLLKEKKNKVDYIKIKNFYSPKDDIERKKIFPTHHSNKDFIFRVNKEYKELL